MAWTPKTGSTTGGATGDGGPPPPIPFRRRRGVLRAEMAKQDADNPITTRARKANPKQATGQKPPGGNHNSEKDQRTQKSIRLGKRWSEIVMAVKAGEYTWQQFCEDRDEEELARGQLRAEDGSFVGRPPSLVPREFHLACQREQKRRFEEIFGSEVLGIAKQYVELCKNNDIPAKDRAKMMQYAMERIFGGIPKDVRINQAEPWEAMVVNVISEDGQDGIPDHLNRRYAGYAERRNDPDEIEG